MLTRLAILLSIPNGVTKAQLRVNDLPRFALCLSGEVRTFVRTAPRYHELVVSNNMDTFGVIGFDGHRYARVGHSSEAYSNPLEIARQATSHWTSVVKLTSDEKNPLENSTCPTGFGRSALQQAYKIRQCQMIIDGHVDSRRNGLDYELIMRTRFDILLPEQPLNFSRMAEVVNERRRPENHNTPLGISPRRKLHPSVGRKVTQRHPPTFISEEPPAEIRGVLFVPFCCDWYSSSNEGINDQLAIGTPQAMKAYTERIFHFQKDPKSEWGQTTSYECPNVVGEKVTLDVIRNKSLAVHRFWYEYVILREAAVEKFGSMVG